MPILAAICILALATLTIIAVSNSEKRVQKTEAYYKLNDKHAKRLDSNSIQKVQESINELSQAYSETYEYMSDLDKQVYTEDLNDLKDHLHDLEEDKWERKAGPHLQKFMDYYDIVMSGDLNNFKDVDLLLSYKKKCVSEWQKYYAVPLDSYSTTIRPKEYFRRILGSDYDPCMDSSIALEKKLNDHVANARPEQKRKRHLYNLIVSFVGEQESIQRVRLLEKTFDGFTVDEIKYCYKDLVKKNRLVEYKMGNRVFVSLSDSEKSKHPQKSTLSATKSKTPSLSKKDIIVVNTQSFSADPVPVSDTVQTVSLNSEHDRIQFGNWPEDIHSTPSQIQSMNRGLKIPKSIIKLDAQNQSALIRGSIKGEKVWYHVTLSDCECNDFVLRKKRKLPCKHIYCLANELGLLPPSVTMNNTASQEQKNAGR